MPPDVRSIPRFRSGSVLVMGWVTVVVATAAEPTPADPEFFAMRIPPVLARASFDCHGEDSKSARGGLRREFHAALPVGARGVRC